MREFKPKYSTRLDAMQHLAVAKDIAEQDKLLFTQWLNKYRHAKEIPFYDSTTLKAVLDCKGFRLYFAEWQFKKGNELTQKQIIVVLHKEKQIWLVYVVQDWNAPVLLGNIFGDLK